ncbi:MAG: hypothetical protein ACP5N2_05375 [Candidatus Nanoarchaeia archaeon]
MTQSTQKNVAQDSKRGLQDILKPLTDFLNKFSKKEKIAYGLILLGVLLIITGILIW